MSFWLRDSDIYGQAPDRSALRFVIEVDGIKNPFGRSSQEIAESIVASIQRQASAMGYAQSTFRVVQKAELAGYIPDAAPEPTKVRVVRPSQAAETAVRKEKR